MPGGRVSRSAGLVLLAVGIVFVRPALAATLRPATVEAFERYVRLVEARLDGGGPFLWLDRASASGTGDGRAALRAGRLAIEPLTATDAGREIEVPGGLIHHWIGTAFVRGVPLPRVLALLQDYDRHARIYQPHVVRSRLVARTGDEFTAYLRFWQKKVITVVIDSDHQARFHRLGDDRVEGRIRSTRIAEVDHPGTARETLKPVGRDGGYMWRLNTYWRLLEADGGTYLQCESVTLTRDIPTGFGWLVRPFVTSIPRESLTFTLETTRKVLSADVPP